VRRPIAWMAVLALVVGGCSSRTGGASGERDRIDLTVSAAASLTEAFTDIAGDFQAEHPEVRVGLNFGPSDGLAHQIRDGAPVDVFASASPTWMDEVAQEPGVSARADFATNRLAIVVPSDDRAHISRLDDLARPGVRLVLAAEGVPAGEYARQVLEQAGIAREAVANVVSNEEDVRGVIAKVLSGDADAGICYVTDVSPVVAPRLRLVDIPRDVNVIATYPIAVVSGSKEADLAQRFVDYVLGPGQDVLARYGFLAAG
jgi:molybdate transport system substrate-binding protein